MWRTRVMMNGRSAVILAVSAAACLAGCKSSETKAEEDRIKALTVDFSAERRGVISTLETFHIAASKANLASYTACFAPDLVFLGTDPNERWNAAEFTAFAKSYFDQGKGWTYTLGPRGRSVSIDQDGSTAWFDEELVNEKYGLCRGSGVLRKIGGRWMISQYNLAFTVHNEAAERVVQINKASASPIPAR